MLPFSIQKKAPHRQEEDPRGGAKATENKPL